MAKITKLNHIAIVVRDIEESLKFWEESLGLTLDHIEVVPSRIPESLSSPSATAKLSWCSPPAMKPVWLHTSKNEVKACTIFAWKWTTLTRN